MSIDVNNLLRNQIWSCQEVFYYTISINDTEHNDTQHNDTQHSDTQHVCDTQQMRHFANVTRHNSYECCYAESQFAQCRVFIVMLSVVMLNAIMLWFIMLNEIMLWFVMAIATFNSKL